MFRLISFVLTLIISFMSQAVDGRPIFDALDSCEISRSQLNGSEIRKLARPDQVTHSDGTQSRFATIRLDDGGMVVPIRHEAEGDACLSFSQRNGIATIRFWKSSYGELTVRFGASMFYQYSGTSHSSPVESIFHLSRKTPDGRHWSQQSRELFVNGQFSEGRYLVDGNIIYSGSDEDVGRSRLESFAEKRREQMTLPMFAGDVKETLLERLGLLNDWRNRPSLLAENRRSSVDCGDVSELPNIRISQNGEVSTQSAGAACATACGSAVGCAAVATGATAATGGVGAGTYVACTGAAGGCGYCIGSALSEIF